MSHNAIMMLCADEARFLTVMSSQVLICLDAGGQVELVADGFQGQETVKIDPFAAVLGPGAAAKRLPKPRLYNRLLQFNQMFANHGYGTNNYPSLKTTLTLIRNGNLHVTTGTDGINHFQNFRDVLANPRPGG